MRYKIDDSKPHPMLEGAKGWAADVARNVYTRREAVFRALVEHCGGVEAARERVTWAIFQRWDPSAPFVPFWHSSIAEQMDDLGYDHVFLDGVLVWVGGIGYRLRWRERFTPECPEGVVDAVPAQLGG